MKDFAPGGTLTQKEYVETYFKECKEAYANLQKNGLPDSMLFVRYHQRFNYRITPTLENEKAAFAGIDLYYYNGEINWTKSGEHTLNTMRAKLRKIVINWNIGETHYGGYFWTDEKKIIKTFADFYGNDAEEEGNLIIEVKESNKEFQFFLQNSYKKVEIPVEDMQFIIFKDKFEFSRSKNYDKPQGGWTD
jgi:hypothetical protein